MRRLKKERVLQGISLLFLVAIVVALFGWARVSKGYVPELTDCNTYINDVPISEKSGFSYFWNNGSEGSGFNAVTIIKGSMKITYASPIKGNEIFVSEVSVGADLECFYAQNHTNNTEKYSTYFSDGVSAITDGVLPSSFAIGPIYGRLGGPTNVTKATSEVYLTLHEDRSFIRYCTSSGSKVADAFPERSADGTWNWEAPNSIPAAPKGMKFDCWSKDPNWREPLAPGTTEKYDGYAYPYYVEKNAEVTFDPNGASGDPPAPVEYGELNTEGIIAPDKGNLVLENGEFIGWGLTRTAYDDGERVYANVQGYDPMIKISPIVDTTVYAQWSKRITLRYDSNGPTAERPAPSFAAKTEMTESSKKGKVVFTLENPDESWKTQSGYSFRGWCLSPDGEGTLYQGNAKLTVDEDTTVYAIWKKNDYTITYKASNVYGVGNGTVLREEPHEFGETVYTWNPENTVLRKGYVLRGWSLKSTGTSWDYNCNEKVVLDSSMTLYPYWEKASSGYLTYDYNYGKYSGKDSSTTSFSLDGVKTINITTIKPTRAGYTFAGWSTKRDDMTKKIYDGGEKNILLDKDMTVYALWEPLKWTLTYNANAGSDTIVGEVPDKVSVERANADAWYNAITISDQGTMARNYYKFLGWATSASGAVSASYAPGTSINLSANKTLYAKWEDLKAKNKGVTLTYNANFADSSLVTGMPMDENTYYDDNINNEALIAEQRPVLPGYLFMGWSEDKNESPDSTTLLHGDGETKLTVIENKTLYAIWKQNISTLQYDANIPEGDPNPLVGTFPTAAVKGSVLKVNKAKDFYRSHYIFKEWNTQPDGGGESYAAGASITLADDTTLYAIWEAAPEYRVTYAGETNGPTGALPVDNNTYYGDGIESSQTVTVMNNTQTWGGHTFEGWSKTSGSSNVDYEAGATFKITGNTTLYAVWSTNDYKVIFNGNGHDSGSVPGMLTLTYGETRKLPAKKNVTLKKNGCKFDGWATTPTGDAAYEAGADITVGADFTSPLTLYAHWSPADTCQLIYDANANGGTVEKMPDNAAISLDGISNVNYCLDSAVPTRDGYTFNGWSTTRDNSSNDSRLAGSTITVGASTGTLTLYAQWAAGSYTLTYHFNGGSDPMYGQLPRPNPVTGTPETTNVTVAGQGTLAREFYKFIGWNTKADGSGETYNIGAPVRFTADVDLYAQWKDLKQELKPDDPDYPNPDPDDPDHPNPGGGEERTGEAFLCYNSNVPAQEAELIQNMPVPNPEGGHYNDRINDKATVSGQRPQRLGYEFKGWSENPKENPDSNDLILIGEGGVAEYKIEVIKDKTLYAIWSPGEYTLRYNANVPANDKNPVKGTFPAGAHKGGPETAITIDAATGFSREHYDFKEWNTKVDAEGNGTGTAYAVGASVNLRAPMTLYAIWQPKKYTVAYDPGEGSGTPPGQHTGAYGGSFTAEEPAGLTCEGRSFAGWKDENGNTYTPGISYTLEGNLTLTAQWATDIYTIKYVVNGAKDPVTLPDSTAELNASVTLPSGDGIKKAQSVFKGWCTDPDGKAATVYDKGAPFTITAGMGTDKVITLYGIWEPAKEYKVTYNKNASDAQGQVPPEATCYNDGITETTEVPVLAEGSLTRPGHTFLGWSTSFEADARVEYTAGSTVEPVKAGKSIELYAVWQADSYTITYLNEKADVTGTLPDEEKVTAGKSTKAAAQGKLLLEYHKFTGWNTQSDYSGHTYKPKDTITPTGDMKLYAQWAPLTENDAMTVTYHNGYSDNKDDTLPVDTNKYYDDGIHNKAVIQSQKPKRAGHNFLYWTSEPDGSGDKYYGTGLEKATITGDLHLYAQWIKGTYTLSYHPGEAPGEVQGLMPPSVTKPGLTEIKVKSNKGLFSRPYHSFIGWNTKEDGSGQSYQPGDTLTLGENTKLYAQWEETNYQVKYDLNPPLISKLTGTVPDAVSGAYEETFTVAPQGDIKCQRYKFMGWNTRSDGKGTAYEAGKEYEFKVFESYVQSYGNPITLYAQWKPVPPFSVVYRVKEEDLPYVTGDVPVDKNEYIPEEGTNIANVLGSGSLKKKGYEFHGWTDQYGNPYVKGSQIFVTEHIVLSAEWIPGVYELTFDRNGAEGEAPSKLKRASNIDITAPGAGKMVRKGYEFLGWAKKKEDANAKKVDYRQGDKFRIKESTTLYAVWRRLLNVSIEENEGLLPNPEPVQQVSEGTKLSEITLPNVKTGYEISYWIVNGTKVTNPKDYIIREDSEVQAVVNKKPVKKPDDKKLDDKKPDDNKPDNKKPDDGRKPDNSRKPNDNNNPGGNNPNGGNHGGGLGGDTTRLAKNTGESVDLGDSAPVKKNNATGAGSNITGTGNDGSEDEDTAAISQNGYPSPDAGGSGYGAKGAMLFGLPWARAMECIIHLIILLCMLLWLALTIYWRVHTRKKREEDESQGENEMAQDNERDEEKKRRRPSVLFDSVLPMLPIALSIILYQFRRCPLDIIMLIIWLVLTVLNLFLERRSFKKRYQETAKRPEAAELNGQ